MSKMREVKINIIDNNSVECRMINDNVFHAYLKPDATCSSEEVDLIIDEYNRLTSSRPLKFLLEMAPFASIDINGCETLQKSNIKTMCEAIITSDLAQSLIINFYFRNRPRSHPSKSFKTRDQAIDWLESCEQ